MLYFVAPPSRRPRRSCRVPHPSVFKGAVCRWVSPQRNRNVSSRGGFYGCRTPFARKSRTSGAFARSKQFSRVRFSLGFHPKAARNALITKSNPQSCHPDEVRAHVFMRANNEGSALLFRVPHLRSLKVGPYLCVSLSRQTALLRPTGRTRGTCSSAFAVITRRFLRVPHPLRAKVTHIRSFARSKQFSRCLRFRTV